ncbi:HD domain-containing phosphohydrolase [Telmatospirillum sp.]|uniref:HD domain-containing phosphohydrolase n=1 Tax=Telmatospirillum sp. TaxID=2079197 RepID=UPI00283D765F|nr:HD domain-containing phosphohydrolase [Telmatospirillum sp.]MDR3436064.1 HD domain-containing phosphohydrolase [Telmatospirillum sp.]
MIVQGKIPDKHLVAIVDGNVRHREQLSATLQAYYSVHIYGDSTNALMGLGVSPPGLVLVGEYVPPSSGVNFIRALRFEREMGQTPVVFISDNGDPDVLAAALSAGATDCIIKPYRRSALLNVVSAQINMRVEKSWKDLPTLACSALQDTLTLFGSIADIFDQSYPIQYGAVAESCASIVDAVTTNVYPAILEGVHDHDQVTFVHSLRAATLLALFGHSIGLPRPQQILLACGGLLHDVGKLGIRHSVLNKTENLTDDEKQMIRDHVGVGVSFLRGATDMPKGILTITGQHHERLDGSGYPQGLAANQLNELARMSAVVDIFTAMTDPRMYKPRYRVQEALKIMTDEMSSQIDQELVARFREILLDTLPKSAAR